MNCIIKLVLVLSLIACSKASDKVTIDGKQFTGSDYTLMIPDGWETKENFMGNDLLIMNPDLSESPDFASGLGVTLENLPDSIDQEEYVEMSTTLMKEVMGAEVSESEQCKLNGIDATRLRYQASFGKRNMDNDCYLIVRDQAAYIVTLSTLAGEGRDERIQTLFEVAKTFELE